jgi:hypothetical protein
VNHRALPNQQSCLLMVLILVVSIMVCIALLCTGRVRPHVAERRIDEYALIVRSPLEGHVPFRIVGGRWQITRILGSAATRQNVDLRNLSSVIARCQRPFLLRRPVVPPCLSSSDVSIGGAAPVPPLGGGYRGAGYCQWYRVPVGTTWVPGCHLIISEAPRTA